MFKCNYNNFLMFKTFDQYWYQSCKVQKLSNNNYLNNGCGKRNYFLVERSKTCIGKYYISRSSAKISTILLNTYSVSFLCFFFIVFFFVFFVFITSSISFSSTSSSVAVRCSSSSSIHHNDFNKFLMIKMFSNCK